MPSKINSSDKKGKLIYFRRFLARVWGFVRSLSDALKFRPWLLFRLFACISSGFGRFVALWGLCCVVCGLWSVPRMLCAFTVGRFRSPSIAGSFSGLPALVGCFAALPGAVFRPLWAFILLCGFFFACGRFFVLWAFYGFGLLAAVPLLGVVVAVGFWVWFARRFFGFLLGSFAACEVFKVQ